MNRIVEVNPNGAQDFNIFDEFVITVIFAKGVREVDIDKFLWLENVQSGDIFPTEI